MADATKKRFLVVDDEPGVRRLLSEILSKADCAVDMAENGKHALQMLNTNSYDMIISDVNMPEMDGITFYLAILEIFPEMRNEVLFMTGGLTDEVMVFFKKYGCKYLAKPNLFDESVLLEEIKRMLDK